MTEMLFGWKKDLCKQQDKNGSTPLHFAVSLGKFPYIRLYGFECHWESKAPTELLLEACPSLAYQPDNDGSFPIHIASSTGMWRAISILLKRCPSCATLRNAHGGTFLHVAIEKKRYSIVANACRQQKLSSVLNVQDNDGNTALHVAAQAGYMRIFCALLKNREVRLNLTNKDGQTPLDIARSKGIYRWGKEKVIDHALVRAGAKHGRCRGDRLKEKYASKKVESDVLAESTQTLGIGSVLIATVTFGVTFALPGGYRADDHTNGGTPTLAGRYTFDMFIMANTLAFICSSIATLGIMYSGISMVNLSLRRQTFFISLFFASSSVTSLVAAFALGVYMVLDPVDPKTAIAICAISPVVVLFRNIGRFQHIYLLAGPLYVRMGLWALPTIARDILSKMFVESWPLIIIFSWAAYNRYFQRQ